jgi:hypothetical protein
MRGLQHRPLPAALFFAIFGNSYERLSELHHRLFRTFPIAKIYVTMRAVEIEDAMTQLDTPHEFMCPISMQLMRDPVIASELGLILLVIHHLTLARKVMVFHTTAIL